MSRRDHQPLSARKLSQLAKGQILGPELLAEVRGLGRQGFQFDLHYGNGVPVSAVTALLLGHDVQNAAYLALGVASKRAEALAAARQDPAFLRIRPEDFRFRAFDDQGPQEFVSEWHREILELIGRANGQGLGISWGRDRSERENSVYSRQEQPYDRLGSGWGLVDERFAAGLEANQLTWLDLLRHPDTRVRQLATAYLDDPADPEAVTIALIDHRLNRLESEIELALELEYEQALEQAAQAVEAAHDREVEDAWSGFFGDGKTAPVVSDLDDAGEAPTARHPRGAAEMLGDLDR